MAFYIMVFINKYIKFKNHLSLMTIKHSISLSKSKAYSQLFKLHFGMSSFYNKFGPLSDESGPFLLLSHLSIYRTIFNIE